MGKKEEALKRLKERELASKKRFKLPEGDTTFRLLPNKKGTELAEYVEYGMHSNIGPRNEYLRCGHKRDGSGDCWLCDEKLPELEKSGKASKQQAAQDMARFDKFAIQIAVKTDDDEWTGPFLWEMPQSLANELLGMLGKRDLADVEKGWDLSISRTGTTRNQTRYGKIERADERSEAPENVLKKLKPFAEVIPQYDEDDMKAAYYGHEQDEEEEKPKKPSADEDEEETPKKKKSADEDEEETPRKKKKPAEADEDEEEKPKKKKPAADDDDLDAALSEDDSDIPDLDDEEEKPKKKSKKAEEDDDSGQDDEEEQPKKKSKKGDEDEEEKPKKKTKPVDDDDF